MTCKEARALAIESVRRGVAVSDPHFAACPQCARFLEAQLALDSGFAALPREVPAPANLDATLLAEFDRAHRPRTRGFRWWPAAVAALAASLTIAVVRLHRTAPAPRLAAEPFVEIPYIAPLAPYERTSIVRMDVPVSALIAAGFDVHAVDTGAALTADVLFGQDGRARAFRPVSNSISNRRIIQ
jgi:hypothetical protein